MKIKKIMNTSIIKVRIFCRSQKFAARGICPFPPLNAPLQVRVPQKFKEIH
jgi:hypothetical protein